MAKPLPPPRKPPIPKSPPSAPAKQKRETKKFSIGTWTGQGEGEKIVVCGPSGAGKTTLCTMLPNPVFIGLDDGGRKIRHPVTGEPIVRVEGIESFQDVQDALHQFDLWPKAGTCVIDTFTILESLAEPWMFDNIPHEKGGHVTTIEGYGYGKGWTHLYETMRSILQDLDGLVRRGVNVVLICQQAAVRRANAAGIDYLEDGPKLSHPTSEKTSVRLHTCEWADHVLRIAYQNAVQKDEKDRVGKATGAMSRLIHVRPEPHAFAKSRTIQLDDEYAGIGFDKPDDNAIWQYIFGGC